MRRNDDFEDSDLGYVYILANGRNGSLYIGVTSDLVKRIHQHKSHAIPGFTSRYGIDPLVWFEQCGSIVSAITREKQLKSWKRVWKIELIEANNPYWNGLYASII
jgi:putative endonuclease